MVSYKSRFFIFIQIVLIVTTHKVWSQDIIGGKILAPDKKGISGIRVYAQDFEDNYVTTAADGSYTLDVTSAFQKSPLVKIYIVQTGSPLRKSVRITQENVGKTLNIALESQEFISKKKDVEEQEAEADRKKKEQELQDKRKKTLLAELARKDSIRKSQIDAKRQSTTFVLPDFQNIFNSRDDNQRTVSGEENISLETKLDNGDQVVIAVDEKIVDEIKNIAERLKNEDNISDSERAQLLKRMSDYEAEIQRSIQAQQKALADINSVRSELTYSSRLTQYVIWAAAFAILLLMIVILIVNYLSRQRKKQMEVARRRSADLQKLNKGLSDLNEELTDKNNLIENQLAEISEQRNRIQDSIRSATLIQQSILPEEIQLEKELGEHFIIYEPKDIVSGDFYWYNRVGRMTFLAVADCTGHGVPGALMSMIGYNILNEIVVQFRIYDPAEILEELHIRVFSRLKQSQRGGNDGMDIGICCIDRSNDNYKITYAGAKRPLYMVKDNVMHILKGTRRGIGGLKQNLDKLFENQTVELKGGELIYLTSDGYADTPNKDRKSFGSNRLIQLLEQISIHSLSEQKEILLEKLAKYQEGEPNRDDVTIVAIKL